MKAKVKSTGEIVAVDLYTMSYDEIELFIDHSTGKVYKYTELDLKFPENESVMMSGWIARSGNGDIDLFAHKPKGNFGNRILSTIEGSIPLDKSSFPNQTCQSEPQEVEIIIKRKKK